MILLITPPFHYVFTIIIIIFDMPLFYFHAMRPSISFLFRCLFRLRWFFIDYFAHYAIYFFHFSIFFADDIDDYHFADAFVADTMLRCYDSADADCYYWCYDMLILFWCWCHAVDKMPCCADDFFICHFLFFTNIFFSLSFITITLLHFFNILSFRHFITIFGFRFTTSFSSCHVISVISSPSPFFRHFLLMDTHISPFRYVLISISYIVISSHFFRIYYLLSIIFNITGRIPVTGQYGIIH